MEDNKFKISDLGIIVTIGGVLLYSLGWVYWKAYFKGLNVEISFIDLPIDRVISTTYVILVIYLCMFSILLLLSIIFREKNNLIIILNLIMSIILFVIFVNISDYSANIWILLLGMITILVFFYFLLLYFQKIKSPISFTKSVIIFFSLVVVFSFYLYYRQGKYSSQGFINSYKVNIIITTKDNKTISGKFIGLMKNNYFILIKNNGIYETYAIREDEVYQVKLMDKLLIKTPKEIKK